ncbi:MAG: 4-(cytidine 5'-diphospho)-2-C-methyl-D-erythritol kinase [Bacteroidales bacterium]|nr:4-(cytidine 5'-diphospho)-2-C-methyl-D-erythritol kinase [Bacteroidales bacterium]
MITFPCAKINLGLDILRRRPDGYHDIATAMYRIPWRDVLEIVPTINPATTLTTEGRPVDCPPEKNLVMKAYRALAEEVTDLPPVDIYLEKVIPDGAGLGGGSADAAYTLTLLRDALELPLSDEQLASVAARVGADCPFFVYPHECMMATGTGTTLSPLALTLKGWWIVVVKPPVNIPTREAYAGVTPSEPAEPLERLLLTLPVEQWQGRVKNDFEPSIFAKAPEVRAIKERLLELGATYASMSGSGSAVYGLMKSDRLAESCRDGFEGCDMMIARLD